MQLKDKVIVVTGGAGLLGSTLVKKISLEDGIPIIADTNIENGTRLAKSVRTAEFFNLDITSKNSAEKLIIFLQDKFGRIDALVNNAYPRNKNYGRHFFDVEYNDFCDNLNLNLGGYFLMSQCFSNYFLKQGNGNIINIASIYGVAPPRFEIYEGTQMTTPVEYAAIKSSLIHLTKYMAKLFKGKNIRVNSVSPGGILDNQPEEFLEKYYANCLNKGMLDKEDLTGVVKFLLSDESKYINGQNIIVDDGFTL